MYIEANTKIYLSKGWERHRLARTPEFWLEEKAEAKQRIGSAPRAGLLWSEKEEKFLLYAWPRICLADICLVLGRTPEGVMARLATHGRLRKEVSLRGIPYGYALNEYFEKVPGPIPDSVKFTLSNEKLKVESSQRNRRIVAISNTNAAESAAPTPKENPMKIETRTFINGVDASTLSDDAIFNEIAEIEAKIAHLRNLKTQSRKRDQAIAKMEKYAVDLAAYLDGR